MRLQPIPEPTPGDGACGPAALYALLGGDRPGDHRAALRRLGWRTPCGLGAEWAERYLRELGRLRARVDYDAPRATLARWAELNPHAALVAAGHHWIAYSDGWVCCGLHPEPVRVEEYPRRRSRVVTALYLTD